MDADTQSRVTQAAALTGSEIFQELLAELPDSFFAQSDEKREAAWNNIRREFVRGERDVAKLARAAFDNPNQPIPLPNPTLTHQLRTKEI